MINELSLFSGYGGLTLGLRLAGLNVRTVAYVEWDNYPQEIIKARIRDQREGRFGLDDAPIFSDISSFRGEQFRGVVDIITAGFPCQPHSVAGLQRGDTDERNKWPDTLRVIREVEPRWVVLENVPGLLSSSSDGGTPAYGGTVVGELAQVGYSVHWRTLGADDVGAPHRRKRWFCIGVLADSSNDGLYREAAYEAESSGNESPDGLFVRGYPAKRAELADSGGRRYWQSNKEICSGGDTPEHGIGVLADSDSNRTRRDQSEHWEGGGSEQASQDLADGNNEGLEGIGANGHQERWQEQTVSPGLPGGTIPVWPPGPSDGDGWAELIERRPDLAPALTKEAESQFRGVDDGRSHRVDELKALGNGVVPAVVAAFLRRVE